MIESIRYIAAALRWCGDRAGLFLFLPMGIGSFEQTFFIRNFIFAVVLVASVAGCGRFLERLVIALVPLPLPPQQITLNQEMIELDAGKATPVHF